MPGAKIRVAHLLQARVITQWLLRESLLSNTSATNWEGLAFVKFSVFLTFIKDQIVHFTWYHKLKLTKQFIMYIFYYLLAGKTV